MKHFYKFYIFYCIFIVISAYFSVGSLQADEHFRVLEAAHKLVYGYAALPWEMTADPPLVSYFLGALLAPILKVTKYFHFSGLTEAFILRAFTGLIASTRVIAFYKILKLLPVKQYRIKTYLLLFAIGVFGPFLLVRTSQENWSTLFFTWAMWLLLHMAHIKSLDFKLLNWRELLINKNKNSVLNSKMNITEFDWNSTVLEMLFGIMLALTFSARFQMGFASAGLGILFYIVFGFLRSCWVLIGILLGLLPMAFVDLFTYGMPFAPVLGYLNYGMSGNDPNYPWGRDPWYFYIETFFTTFYPPLSVVLFVFVILGIFKYPIFLFSFLPFAAINFYFTHKEIRYFSTMIPTLFLSCYLGYEFFENKFLLFKKSTKILKDRGFFKVMFVINLFLGIGIALFPQNTAPYLFDYVRVGINNKELTYDDITYVADTINGMPQFYYKSELQVPQQLTLATFLKEFNLYEEHGDVSYKPVGVFAIFKIASSDLHRIEKYCKVEFLSIPTTVRKILDWHPKVFPKKHVHAVVRCP